MLAQSFKTAVELDLKESQFEALKKVLVLLETNKLQHYSVKSSNSSISNKYSLPEGEYFNMCVWTMTHTCGTIACIGGTAEALGAEPFNQWIMNSQLRHLFMPPFPCSWARITTEQAARALRSFLTTGQADWSDL